MPQLATIASGASLSDAVDLGASTLARLDFPAAMTGTSVTIYPLQADGTTYAACKDEDGVAPAIVVNTSTPVLLYRDIWKGVRKFKIKSNQNEGAARSIYCWGDAFSDDGTPL